MSDSTVAARLKTPAIGTRFTVNARAQKCHEYIDVDLSLNGRTFRRAVTTFWKRAEWLRTETAYFVGVRVVCDGKIIERWGVRALKSTKRHTLWLFVNNTRCAPFLAFPADCAVSS